MTDTDDFEPAFELPTGRGGHPADIAARLLQLPEHFPLHEHEVRFGWLMRTTPKEKGGRTELGSVHDVKTMFQGGFKDLGLQLVETMLGYLPQYLVIIDAQWWQHASDHEKSALIYHELSHVKQAVDKFGALKYDRDGYPVWRIVGHDVEAFNAEVRRYGTWAPDLQQFSDTLREVQ